MKISALFHSLRQNSIEIAMAFVVLISIIPSFATIITHSKRDRQDLVPIEEITMVRGNYQHNDNTGKISGAVVGGATSLLLGKEKDLVGVVMNTAVGAGSGATLGSFVDNDQLLMDTVVRCSFQTTISAEVYMYTGSINDNDESFQKCTMLKKGDSITVSSTEYFNGTQRINVVRTWR